ncbi:hypothetical protein, conserved, partial [Babesia bigemina]
MGFLSGVLNAVKDDDAVRTYDKDISGDKIDTVISMLQSSIGTGRIGLAVSVGAVREWLEGYWKEVDGKNKNVTDSLTKLIMKLSDKYLTEIRQTDKLQVQLTAWMTTIGNIDSQLTAMDAQQVGALDVTLKEKITHEINSIKTAVLVLHDSAGDGVFGWQVKEVDNVLINQEKYLESEIRNKSIEFKNVLTTQFDNLSKHIGILNRDKNKHFKNLNNVVTDAQNFLETFDNEYESVVSNAFQKIKDEMTEINNHGADKCALELQVDKIKSELLS